MATAQRKAQLRGTLQYAKNQGFDRSRITDDNTIKVRCSQCEALVINGVPCHEQGCPNKPSGKRSIADEDQD